MMVQNRSLKHAYLIPLFLFAALLLDGVMMKTFASQFITSYYVLTPRLLLLVFVLFAVFFPKQPLFLYALLFGMINDSFYSGILGLYAAGLAIILYVLKKVHHRLNPSPMVILPIYAAALIFLELFVYAVYHFIGFVNFPFSRFLIQRLGPTLLLNTLFFVAFYYPFYRLSQWMAE